MKRTLAVFFILFAIITYKWAILPALLSWGATPEEFNSERAGDSWVPNLWYKNTLAVTVHASPTQIYPWLKQMGVGRGGFYSYTWLENMFGCDLHNADTINTAWQQIDTGYYEPVCQSAYNNHQPGWIIAVINEPESFVYRGAGNSNWMMGFYVDSISPQECRLITRQQFNKPVKKAEYLLEVLWWNWAHCIMQHGVITGIKKRVEKQHLY
ncbi:MAG TPA: hypothetical protein VK174_01040 [Chitinophagales bacterium]|nr:hypothetical protein [Chitinophagales bacterium]